MKKMFLKKLMCLVLSLAFSISPILSNPIVFSSDSFNFPDLSNLDDYYSGEEEEEEEDIDLGDWDEMDITAEEALKVSMAAVGDGSSQYEANPECLSAYEENVFCFKAFWNYLVGKYVFLLADSIHKQTNFENSLLYLDEKDDIPEEFLPILYNLAIQLKSCYELCDRDDLLQVEGVLQLLNDSYEAKEVDGALLTIEKTSGEPLISLQKFVNKRDDVINSSVANSIYAIVLGKDEKDKAAEEALGVSREAVRDGSSQYEENVFCFKAFWNYLVKKYVSEPSYFIHGCLYFKNSLLYLDEKDDIPEKFFPILYNLAVQLKSCNQLCDKGDLLQITGILKMFSNRYCLEDSGSTLVTIEKSSGKSLIALPKFVNRKNDLRNSGVANSIYEKILIINAFSFFAKSWNIIVKKYVFDRCKFSHLCFKDSNLFLTDDFLEGQDEKKIEEITFFALKTLYSLTNHLLNSEELRYEDREFINNAKFLVETLLINAGQFPSRDLLAEIFQESKEKINNESARKIYDKIYKKFLL